MRHAPAEIVTGRTPPIEHGHPGTGPRVVAAALEALAAGHYSAGAPGREAEAALARFLKARAAVLVSGGQLALIGALAALGVGAGDRVALPVLTCPSVWQAVRALGARPVPVDVAEDLPLLPAEAPPPGCAAVVVPQMFGLRRNLDAIARSGVPVIEDLAQCFGPSPDPHAVLAVCSFSPTKLLTAGPAGAVVGDDARLLQRVRAFFDAEDDASDAALPFRLHAPLSGFQSAMLLAQLDRHGEAVAARRHWVAHYDRRLGMPRLVGEVPFRYLLRLPRGGDAVALAARMQAHGVMAHPAPAPLLHRRFRCAGAFPNAERWHRSLLSLPLHEGLDAAAVDRVCDLLEALG